MENVNVSNRVKVAPLVNSFRMTLRQVGANPILVILVSLTQLLVTCSSGSSGPCFLRSHTKRSIIVVMVISMDLATHAFENKNLVIRLGKPPGYRLEQIFLTVMNGRDFN